MKRLSLMALFVVAVTLNTQANLLISYNGHNFGLFSDSGTLIRNYASTIGNAQGVTVDSSGNAYVADYNGAINMYDISSGAFVRDVLGLSGYHPIGLTYNPNNPGEIIYQAWIPGASLTQLGRLNTSTTGSVPGANNGLGAGYSGLYYSGGTVYMAGSAAGGLIQSFNANSANLDWTGNTALGIGTPNGITGIGANIYYTDASANSIVNLTTSSTLVSSGLNYPDGITTDGTSLWVADYANGLVKQYDASGTLLSQFALNHPVYIAYTTNSAVPFGSPIAINNSSFEVPFTADPTNGWANAGGGTWGSPFNFSGLMSLPATDGTGAAFGNGGVAYQILTNHTVLAGTYTILVDVGHRNDSAYTPFTLGVYSVNLPGNAVETLGNFTLATDPPLGGWSTLEATFTITNGSPAIGGNLQLTLVSPGVQTVIDNVRAYVIPSEAPVIPALHIHPWTGNQVRLSWTTNAPGFTLESTASLPGGWTTNAASVSINGTNYEAFDTLGAGHQFYRLIK